MCDDDDDTGAVPISNHTMQTKHERIISKLCCNVNTKTRCDLIENSFLFDVIAADDLHKSWLAKVQRTGSHRNWQGELRCNSKTDAIWHMHCVRSKSNEIFMVQLVVQVELMFDSHKNENQEFSLQIWWRPSIIVLNLDCIAGNAINSMRSISLTPLFFRVCNSNVNLLVNSFFSDS